MKNIFLFVLLVFSSNMIAQQVYGVQRGQRGYIPPPKYEASVYITTLNAYEELEKAMKGCDIVFHFASKTAVNEMKWFDALSAGKQHTDFFANRVTNYSKGHLEWDAASIF